MSIVCPHCNAKSGFYIKETVTGTAYTYYTEKGDYAIDQTKMYTYLNHIGGKIAYCVECKKRIGKSKDLISGKTEENIEFR
ncbi:hypothetical protein [Ureibacillus sp. GCM10028918]|uniref:hypothetical protein n=1 Tax=Ureibacillus sp. GCM10028918 TaxID=3273429 RepID=UPI0036108C6D